MKNTKPQVTLSLTAEQHLQLRVHLFPGDGKEAAAIILCGRRAGAQRHRLLAREIHIIPHGLCSNRTSTSITWSTDLISSALDKAEKEGLSVVKVHSHPSGYPDFSQTDDDGDSKLLPAISGWVEKDIPHGSVVMLPSGQMFGRTYWSSIQFDPISCISVVGPDIHFWHSDDKSETGPSFTASHAQAFAKGTINKLQSLRIAVVGCSGTGSPVIEQLARLGVGKLVLVDDDTVEERNVNRILNSTMSDAANNSSKVDVIADSIRRMGLGTIVDVHSTNLWNTEVIKAVAECDVVFGCMDTASGRFLLNTIATFYTLPYFDLGVRLDAVPDGADKGQIREVCGTVHYLQPGLSSLVSRGLVNMDRVRAEGLKRNDPDAYGQQLKDGYIQGVQENQPAVISVNMFIASLAVNDFLARIHPYREMPNTDIASIEFSLSSLEFYPEPEDESCSMLRNSVGAGDVEPLLLLIELSVKIK